jgi:hypothetical protein
LLQFKEDVTQAQLKRDARKEKNWNVTLTSLATPDATTFGVVDHVLSSKLIDGSSMVFVGSTDMELKIDFLNRVRLNSVQVSSAPWVTIG